MHENKEIYNASDLSKMFSIHPNTVRLYERLGFISQAQRSSNNYRIFEELHVLQIRVCRCIFGYPFTNRRIRNAGNEIMWAIAKKRWDTARHYTDCYLKIIELEIKKAEKATEMVHEWVNLSNDKGITLEERKLSRKEVAHYFGVTVETIRNWERNGLIKSVEVGEKGKTLYTSEDLGRMGVIFMLLQVGYSIASIHRSISVYDKGCPDLVTSALNNPKHDDFISVGDRWRHELLKLMDAAKKIHPIIDMMKKL